MAYEGIIGIIILSWILWKLYDINKKNTIHLDGKGYERDGYGNLVHRKVAYKHIYSYPKYPHRFGYYDIHHIDKNKRNNHPSNLKILTREEHKKIHGR